MNYRGLHIRLIDFDAARMLKPGMEQEQDTVLLGTRGYAPPEQYGFSQTDERAEDTGLIVPPVPADPHWDQETGVTYTDSPYVLSDGFEYTGADAPRLPAPEDLSWIVRDDEEGEWVNSDFYYKKELVENGWSGIRIPAEYVRQRGKSYRFAIQVTSSRPNQYRASPEVFLWPVEEEYLSPWLRNK